MASSFSRRATNVYSIVEGNGEYPLKILRGTALAMLNRKIGTMSPLLYLSIYWLKFLTKHTPCHSVELMAPVTLSIDKNEKMLLIKIYPYGEWSNKVMFWLRHLKFFHTIFLFNISTSKARIRKTKYLTTL